MLQKVLKRICFGLLCKGNLNSNSVFLLFVDENNLFWLVLATLPKLNENRVFFSPFWRMWLQSVLTAGANLTILKVLANVV